MCANSACIGYDVVMVFSISHRRSFASIANQTASAAGPSYNTFPSALMDFTNQQLVMMPSAAQPSSIAAVVWDFSSRNVASKLFNGMRHLLDNPVICNITGVAIREHKSPQSVWKKEELQSAEIQKLMTDVAHKGNELLNEVSRERWFTKLRAGNIETYANDSFCHVRKHHVYLVQECVQTHMEAGRLRHRTALWHHVAMDSCAVQLHTIRLDFDGHLEQPPTENRLMGSWHSIYTTA